VLVTPTLEGLGRVSSAIRVEAGEGRLGGKSGPMPLAALLLKMVVPRTRIDVRNHHRARAANLGPLASPHVIRA
jgi:hypothetical protein